MYLCIFIIFLLTSVSIFAQNQTGGKIFTLDEIIQTALTKNDLIVAKQQLMKSQQYAQKQAGAWENPSLSADYYRKITEGVGANSYSLSLTQPFYFPGKQARRKEIAKFNEQLAALDLEKQKDLTRLQMILAAYQYSALQNLLSHHSERVRRFQTMYRYLNGRAQVSPQLKAESHILQARLRKAEKEFLLLENAREALRAQINLYFDLGQNDKIEVSWITTPENLNFATLEKQIAQNFSLREAKLIAQQTLAEKSLADSARYPDFSISGFINQERSREQENFYGIGATFNLPVFNHEKNNSKSLEAKHVAQLSEKKHLEKSIIQQLLVLYTDYETARKNLILFPLSLIQKEDEQLSALDIGFQKNQLQLLSYLEAENEVYDAHIQVFDNQVKLIEAYCQMMFLTGQKQFPLGELYVK